MYFEKVCSLNLNSLQLYNEWKNATIIPFVTKTMYIRTAVNKSTLDSGQEQNLISGNSKVYDIETYNASSLTNQFKNTYTEEVINQVEKILNNLDLRSTRIKYAALKPGGEIKTHTDEGYSDRYHLVIKTNDHSSITIDNKVFSFSEEGSLYRMYAAVPHSVVNFGSCIRLLLTFDVLKI